VSDDTAQTPNQGRVSAGTGGVDLPDLAADLGVETNPEILPAGGPLRTPLRWLGLAEQGLGVFLLLVILVLVLVQVGQRYVPGTGLPATGEIARLAMVWATFMMCGYLMAHDRHIAIHVVDYFLPVRVLGLVQLFASLVVVGTCVAMAYATWDLIGSDRGQVTAAAEIPLTFGYAVALLGFVSTAIRALVTIGVRDIPEIRSGSKAI